MASFKLLEKREKSQVMMREVLCRTLSEMAKTDPRIVVLDADLARSSGLKPFFDEYPDRAINCGIAEANMVGIAGGLSAAGMVPFAHSFGPFSSRRVVDQMFLAAAYPKLNVRLFGSDPGVTAAANGGTHMPFEDMGCFMSIPGITLIEPCDCVQYESILRQLQNAYGVYYLRVIRKYPVAIFAPGSEFTIGKGVILRDGTDVTLMASGILVADALTAAEQLANEGISARVVNLFTWKPLDTELIAACAAETGAIVTAENHQCIGGLHSAVAAAVCASTPVPMGKVGIQGEFGEVGTEAWLRERFRLTAEAIVEEARRTVARKNG